MDSSRVLNPLSHSENSYTFLCVCMCVCVYNFFFFFFFLGPHLRHMGVPQLGVKSEQQCQIWAMTATYTTAHGNIGYLTHWGRPGIELATSWFLVGFVSTAPQWELLYILFNYGLSQNIEYSSLCCTVRTLLFIHSMSLHLLLLNAKFIPPLPLPLLWQPQVCSLCLWVCFYFIVRWFIWVIFSDSTCK